MARSSSDFGLLAPRRIDCPLQPRCRSGIFAGSAVKPSHWVSIKRAPSPFQPGEAGAKLFNPLHLLTEAAKSDASACGPETEHQRQVTFARGLDGRFGSRSRRGKLPPPVVYNRGEPQGYGDAEWMREPLGESEPRFDCLQGTVGKAKEPQAP